MDSSCRKDAERHALSGETKENDTGKQQFATKHSLYIRAPSVLGETRLPFNMLAMLPEPQTIEDTAFPHVTPARKAFVSPSSVPPPHGMHDRKTPPMLKALKSNSLDRVRAVLQEDPEAAIDLFWDHDAEPPLCCAIRHKCDISILKLLLDSKADPGMKDKHGYKPIKLLQKLEDDSRTASSTWLRPPWDHQAEITFNIPLRLSQELEESFLIFDQMLQQADPQIPPEWVAEVKKLLKDY